MTEAFEGLGLVGFDLTKAEGGKCFFLYASWTPSSSCDLPQHAELAAKRYDETNFECFAIVLDAVSQLAGRFFFYCMLIML